MIRHRTTEEVKRYDIFKLIVTFVLIAILFFTLYGLIDRSPRESGPGTALPVETEAATDDGAVLAPETEAEVAANESPTETEAVKPEGAAALEPEASETAETVTEKVPSPELAAPSLDLPTADRSAGAFTLSGSGQPGSDVEIIANGESLGTATVGADGSWTLAATLDEPGDYDIVINALDEQGQIIASTDPTLYTIVEPVTDEICP